MRRGAIVNTAATRADAHLEDARDAAAIAAAEEFGTFDVESFTDYLFGDCDGCSPVQLRVQLRDVTEADFDGEPTCDVLAIACDPGQPAATRLAALDALIAANAAYRAKQREEQTARAQAMDMVQRFTRRAA